VSFSTVPSAGSYFAVPTVQKPLVPVYYIPTYAQISSVNLNSSSSSYSSPLALQSAVGFGLSNNIPPFFSYLSPTLSIFSLLALEDLFLLPLSIFSWVFPYVSSLPVLE
jgi:hypothetical protein